MGVRELRAEGGTRAEGSPIAVRGVAILELALTSSRPPPEGNADGTCSRWWRGFTLATEGGEPCFSLLARGVRSDRLMCMGDHTETCCAANRSLPKQGDIAVAVGTYLRPMVAFDTEEVDQIEIDYFCSPGRAVGSATKP